MSLGADPRKLDYILEKPRNWKQQNTVFVNEKRGLFFTHSTVRTFFWPSPKPLKWWTKAGPKNTQRDVKSHVLSALPVKKSFEHRKSRRYGEMGAALHDSAWASKIAFLNGTVRIVFFLLRAVSDPATGEKLFILAWISAPIRPRTKNKLSSRAHHENKQKCQNKTKTNRWFQ